MSTHKKPDQKEKKTKSLFELSRQIMRRPTHRLNATSSIRNMTVRSNLFACRSRWNHWVCVLSTFEFYYRDTGRLEQTFRILLVVGRNVCKICGTAQYDIMRQAESSEEAFQETIEQGFNPVLFCVGGVVFARRVRFVPTGGRIAVLTVLTVAAGHGQSLFHLTG